jgi:hypothetical protein
LPGGGEALDEGEVFGVGADGAVNVVAVEGKDE